MTDRLHYPGDVDMPADYVGPDAHGAFYRPLSKSYDADTDRTMIEYTPIPPAEMPERFPHLVEHAEDRVLIKTMFGGEL